jgi:hypothetical protein
MPILPARYVEPSWSSWGSHELRVTPRRDRPQWP